MARGYNDLITELADYVNRPFLECAERIRAVVDYTFLEAQRKVDFNLHTRVIDLKASLYSKDAANLGWQLLPEIKKIHSIALGPTIDAKHLRILTLDQFTTWIHSSADKHGWRKDSGEHFESFIKRVFGNLAVLRGNYICLYPSTPLDCCAVATVFLNAETSLLTSLGYDYFLYRSLQRLSLYYKTDTRYEVLGTEAAQCWINLVSLDNALVDYTEVSTNA
jgi:hypothetical protein